MMKTVADFKRAIKMGVLLHTVYHRETKLDEHGKVVRGEDGQPLLVSKDLGIAPVSLVQTNAFAVERPNKDGEMRNSYCEFPKASQVSFTQNSITIYIDDSRRGRVPVLTYTFVEQLQKAA